MNTFDAEYAVLGACLIVPDAYWRVADLIGPEDFSRDGYAEVWQAIGDTIRAGHAVDAVTFGEHCPKHAMLAMECAVTGAILVPGIATPVPILMRLVLTAANASVA